MIWGKKLVMSNLLKASFFGKLTSQAELFEPKSEPSLGSGATLEICNGLGREQTSTGSYFPSPVVKPNTTTAVI